jgi:hypothetical protein
MKILYLQFLMLVCLSALAISAQQKTEENNKSDKSKADETIQKKRSIWRFSQPEQMFSILEGKWIFADMTCDEPYTVTVSKDKKSIKFAYAKPQKWSDGKERDSFIYRVIELGDYYIRAQIEGEMRKTNDGKAVAWDFMFLSVDEFVWRRTDWEGLSSTKSIFRCQDGKQRTLNKPSE